MDNTKELELIKIMITVGIPSLLVVFGWIITHYLTSKRDLLARKREARIRALETAYMRLANASRREQTEELNREIETFVSEIQLYGTPKQVDIMSKIVNGYINNGSFISYDDILNNLRDTIRSELRLEKVHGNTWWLRFKKIQTRPHLKKQRRRTMTTSLTFRIKNKRKSRTIAR